MIYKYECKEKGCRLTFIKHQSIKDNPLSECPDCGGRIERVISGGAGVIFKGSGFYKTDNRKEG